MNFDIGKYYVFKQEYSLGLYKCVDIGKSFIFDAVITNHEGMDWYNNIHIYFDDPWLPQIYNLKFFKEISGEDLLNIMRKFIQDNFIGD